MVQRAKGQSQLDYLWVNFGKLSVPEEITGGTLITAEEVKELQSNLVSKLAISGQTLIGRNSEGAEITSVALPISSSGGLLLQGSESKSLVLEVKDNVVSGRLKINNEDSLINLVETDKGLKAEFSGDFNKQLEIIKNVSEDISALKEEVKNNSDALLILNGDEHQEGSVLNLINLNIQSAFNWQEL